MIFGRIGGGVRSVGRRSVETGHAARAADHLGWVDDRIGGGVRRGGSDVGRERALPIYSSVGGGEREWVSDGDSAAWGELFLRRRPQEFFADLGSGNGRMVGARRSMG